MTQANKPGTYSVPTIDWKDNILSGTPSSPKWSHIPSIQNYSVLCVTL